MQDTPKSENKELNYKQKRFVAEYLKDQNGKQAAIRAGYSKNGADVTGSQLLAIPRVRELVDAALKTAADRAGVDAFYVIASLKEVVERCLQKKPVMEFDKENKQMVQVTDEDGEGVWEFDSRGATAALELLGKNLKLFTDKHEHSGKDGAAIQVTVTKYA